MSAATGRGRAGARATRQDGRLLRTERSRQSIANAVFLLVGEGNLAPTAQQVADRAGVGVRSVFRHFTDMEALYATVDARLLDELAPLLAPRPPEGPLEERARALVAHRALLFERIAPYKRSSNLMRWRSRYLTRQHRRLVTELRRSLLQWLTELDDAPLETVEALDQATSYEAWDRLRNDQGLGRARAQRTMERAVLALLDTIHPRSGPRR